MPFSYNISLTGDCSNSSSGKLLLNVGGDGSPFTITWNSPVYSTQTFGGSYSLSGLSAGTYSFNLSNSLTPTNESINNISFVVGTGTTSYIDQVVNTSCGLDTGSLNVNFSENNGTSVINLYKNGVLESTQTTNQINYIFGNLSNGVYYCEIIDYGGCTNITENVVIKTSNNLDYGLYIIDNPACSLSNGKIFVTGITGTAPFTYLWSSNIPPQTQTYFATGLTASDYSVTVTDTFGCQVTKTASVLSSSAMGVIEFVPSQPTCSGNDGYVNFEISGGTGPYYYLLSNGDSLVSYDKSFGFSGLNSGNYTLTVTDVALCNMTYLFTLSTPGTFTLISETKIDAGCGFDTGTISAQVQGGIVPYTFQLTNNSGYTNTQISFLPSVSFESLSSDTYTFTISDSGGVCTYTNNITINNEVPFSITASSQSTYCYQYAGQIQVGVINPDVSGLYYQYSLSDGQSSVYTTATTYTFSGLNSGDYTITVNDINLCSQQLNAYVDGLNNYNVVLVPTGCLGGSGGTISALIIDNEGPFNLTWSDNVNGQTGVYLTGLTAGTYYLTVSGTSGCQTDAETTISCNPVKTRSVSYVYDNTSESFKSTLTDFTNLLYNGYIDVTTGHDLCKLNSATFYCDVNLSGVTYSAQFYTTLSLDDVPTISGFGGILEYVILNIPYVESVIVDYSTNNVLIQSQVIGGVEVYKDDEIEVIVRIEYDTSCVT